MYYITTSDVPHDVICSITINMGLKDKISTMGAFNMSRNSIINTIMRHVDYLSNKYAHILKKRFDDDTNIMIMIKRIFEKLIDGEHIYTEIDVQYEYLINIMDNLWKFIFKPILGKEYKLNVRFKCYNIDQCEKCLKDKYGSEYLDFTYRVDAKQFMITAANRSKRVGKTQFS